MSYYKGEVRTALRENGINPDSYVDLTPEERFEWYCVWTLGSGSWADTMIGCLKELGFSVKARKKRAPSVESEAQGGDRNAADSD